jgi:hypothetical protein
MSALFTQTQLAQLLENGRRQAAVKGTADEIDLWARCKAVHARLPRPGCSPSFMPRATLLSISAISAWAIPSSAV